MKESRRFENSDMSEGVGAQLSTPEDCGELRVIVLRGRGGGTGFEF